MSRYDHWGYHHIIDLCWFLKLFSLELCQQRIFKKLETCACALWHVAVSFLLAIGGPFSSSLLFLFFTAFLGQNFPIIPNFQKKREKVPIKMTRKQRFMNTALYTQDIHNISPKDQAHGLFDLLGPRNVLKKFSKGQLWVHFPYKTTK